ncbi:MAG TPA: tetratricopeptide repeat protein [Xanthomonadales bacterium]|nr:tetratricopeptide repeat protein [Xanthomonadales bacterium]
MKRFFQELRRRNVLKVAVAYIVTGWLIIQVLDAVVPMLLLPDWVSRAILLLLLVGFPIALILAWAFELTAEGIKRDAEVAERRPAGAPSGRRIDFVIIGLLVVAVGYFVADKYWLQQRPEADEALPAEASIAVLPFADMSAEQDQEYFADGISEELLNVLARVPGFHVAGRTSSFAFKGELQDVRKIGDMLGVEHVLEGSVRKAGDRVRITAQLIKTGDGFHLWSDTYDRTLDDIFAVQDEIAQAVVAALKTTLLGSAPAEQSPAVTPAGNTEAYDLYLRARYQMHERTPESLERALDYYRQVVTLDPDFAPAWAGLGVTWILASSYSDADMGEAQDRAKAALDRAMELDPADADAWAALGLWYFNVFDVEASARALRRAIELNPNHAMAHMWLGNTLAATDAAGQVAAYQKAYKLDPLHLVVLSNYANGMKTIGDAGAVREAAGILRETHSQSGYGEAQLGSLAYQQGRLDEAARWYLAAYQIAPQRINAFSAFPQVLIDLNEMELADAWLWRAEALAPNDLGALWGRFKWHWKRNDLPAMEAHMRASLEKYPNFPPVLAADGLSHLLHGQADAAVERFERIMGAPAPDGPATLNMSGRAPLFAPWYGASQVAAGKRALAAEVVEAAITELRSQQDQGLRYNGVTSQQWILASLLALQDERQRALEALRRAVADGARDVWAWKADPSLSSLHDDPDFLALATEVEADVARQRARLEELGLLLTPDQALTAHHTSSE